MKRDVSQIAMAALTGQAIRFSNDLESARL